MGHSIKHTLDMQDKKVGDALVLTLLLAAIPALTVDDGPASARMITSTAIAATAAPPIATPAIASIPSASRIRDITPQAREVERLAEQLVAQKHLPGLALAIVQNGQVITLRGYGVTEVGSNQPVTTDTVFRLASLSKAFAATLTGLLVEQDAMNWDAPIVNQLPEFKLRDLGSARTVSARDILSHRVGLTRNTYDRDLESDEPYPLLAERLSNAPMACAPGQCYAYQNIAFSLIGDLTFAATGDFYSHQVETKIFAPLGMYSSTYGRDGLEASASWAHPHVRGRGGWVPVQPKDSYYHVPPAAGVNSSIHDMAQWLIAQMGHRPDVLSPSLLNQIHTPEVATPSELHSSPWRRARLTNAYYALGWRVFDYSGHTLLFHGGAVQGYRSMIGFLPDEDVGMVVLWNSESAAPSGLMPSLMDRVLGLPTQDWLGVDTDDSRD
jgi:beta-lactamase class C